MNTFNDQEPKISQLFDANLPTVKDEQDDVCLQMAIQSLVTDVSGCDKRPWEVQS